METYFSGSNIEPSYEDDFGAEIEINHQSQHQQDKNRTTIGQEQGNNKARTWQQQDKNRATLRQEQGNNKRNTGQQ